MKKNEPESQEILDLRESIIETSFNITKAVSENKFAKAQMESRLLTTLIKQIMKIKLGNELPVE